MPLKWCRGRPAGSFPAGLLCVVLLAPLLPPGAARSEESPPALQPVAPPVRRPHPIVLPPRPPVPPSLSEADAVRFLEQATWGPDRASITRIQTLGLAGWLAEQFAAPASGYPALPLWPDDVPVSCDYLCQRDNYSMYPLQRRFFSNALYGSDQLRQRIAWALHKLLVVSGRKIDHPSALVPYLQILDRNAFGNFRTLLYELTLNPAMGAYLDMVSSTKDNPNENYAREILQLFSVGTVLLNQDGTARLNPATGIPLATYSQATVTNLARVFTGWTYASPPDATTVDFITPMVLIPDNHDTGSKQLLGGTVLPAGQDAYQDLTAALDNIFSHPNVGPYIAKQLIRSLVTSNPTPEYVGRVAAKFNDNGSGVRGDLKSVTTAILLDPEARGQLKTDPAYGRLREPVQLVTNLLRAVGARSASGSGQSDGYLSPLSQTMSQDVFRPKSVFGYFPANYLVPGSTTIRGPEFGILSSGTALARINLVNTMVFSGIAADTDAPAGTSLDFSGLQALSGSAGTLVAELNLVLLHGSMGAAMQADILAAVLVIPASNPLLRAQQAVYLVASSSQYQVER